MRAISILATIGVLILVSLTFVPEASAYHAMVTMAALACAALALVTIIATRGRTAAGGGAATAEPRPAAEAARPLDAAQMANQADAEVISFLATMQQRGRLVDFLMDDITAYSDVQVGAAARVVHDGCRAVLREHLTIRPLREESEGSTVEVGEGFAADEVRFIGAIGGSPPFTGTLVHRGWKVENINLPRLLHREEDRLPTIAPAEVELK
ncbi:MAG: DUF2760 domain-containing protein [Rhodospirillales bacterium]|nr:DUF2760 domain-containing protein [Rhodospirillales bacterium]